MCLYSLILLLNKVIYLFSDGRFGLLNFFYSVLFSAFLKMYLLIVILWRKSTRERFICSKLHLSGVVPRQWRPPSAQTVIGRNVHVCAKLKKNSPNWCVWGPSGYHQMNPSSRCANRANSATCSWQVNSWLVIMDWLYLSPPKALQYRLLLILWFFVLQFVSSFMPLESGMNDQPLTGWIIAEVHLIFKLQNCFYLPWGRPIFLMFKK